MQILFIVLNDLDYLQDVLRILVKHKVKGATILESEGMAKVLAEHNESYLTFGGLFKSSLPKDFAESKTIFSVIHDDINLNEIVTEISKLLSKSEKNAIGFMFTVPVSGIYPIK